MILRVENQTELFEEAADEIFRHLTAGRYDLTTTPIVWGLCGGRSPVGLFQALIPKLTELPASLRGRFRFLQVDERLFEQHNQADLESQIYEPLIAAGAVERSQIHSYPLPASKDSVAIDASAKLYYALLQSFGGIFHVAVLGTGEDGHVAGAFPQHPSGAETKKVFFTFEGSPKPPPWRVTATLPLLADSKLGVLIMTGPAKRAALENFLNPAMSIKDCPAKIVDSMNDQLVLTDLPEI